MSRLSRAIEMAAKVREVGTQPTERDGIEVLVPKGEPAAVSSGAEQLLLSEPLSVRNPFLIASQQGGPAAEEYRKLKSQVLQRTRGTKGGKVLMVTSTVGGEGKTVTSLNLALALGQDYDHTALVVDADLRKPAVHRYLGLPSGPGLIQVLRGAASLDEALVKTGLGKMVVLPAGGTVSDPLELIASGRMKELIRELKERYPDRCIIFDTPPILPFAEAHVLSTLVDGVLFVVRERVARLEHVSEALKMLADAKLLGTVYNDAVSFGGGTSYRYGYERQDAK